MVGIVGAELSFEKGGAFLKDLAGLSVSPKQVERVAEALGEEIAEDERTVFDPDPVADLPSTLYLGLDGTGIPMRPEEVADRPGKQADGSSRTREVKLCVLWSAETTDEEGIPVRDEGSATYSAAIESAASTDTEGESSGFAKRVLRETSRRQFDQVTRQVAVADGAPWIWNMMNEHFPKAIQILDLFHAKEHLGTVGGKRSLVPKATGSARGSRKGMRSLTMERSMRSLPSSGSTLPGSRRRENVSAIWKRTVSACGIPSSGPRDSASPPEWSKPVAR